MTTLFTDRFIANTFLHRNVVVSSHGFVNRLRDVSFALAFDFGKQGIWGNQVTIEVSKTNSQGFINKLSAYHADVKEQIQVLREIEEWTLAGCEKPYSKMLEREKPLLFHACLRKDVMLVQIFGEGMYDLNFRYDVARNGSVEGSIVKLIELRQAMEVHLEAINNAPLQSVLTEMVA